ncbi:MAG: hypothetical protein JW924_04690 [Fusobacteriaceae bacterium]|nr:hypothetical protein [Fusobacteriaceae bacterium]
MSGASAVGRSEEQQISVFRIAYDTLAEINWWKVAKVAFIAFVGIGAGLIKSVQATSRDNGMIEIPLGLYPGPLVPLGYFPSCFDMVNPLQVPRDRFDYYNNNRQHNDPEFFERCAILAKKMCEHDSKIDRALSEALEEKFREIEKETGKRLPLVNKSIAKERVFKNLRLCLVNECANTIVESFYISVKYAEPACSLDELEVPLTADSEARDKLLEIKKTFPTEEELLYIARRLVDHPAVSEVIYSTSTNLI